MLIEINDGRMFEMTEAMELYPDKAILILITDDSDPSYPKGNLMYLADNFNELSPVCETHNGEHYSISYSLNSLTNRLGIVLGHV